VLFRSYLSNSDLGPDGEYDDTYSKTGYVTSHVIYKTIYHTRSLVD